MGTADKREEEKGGEEGGTGGVKGIFSEPISHVYEVELLSRLSACSGPTDDVSPEWEEGGRYREGGRLVYFRYAEGGGGERASQNPFPV